MSQPTLTRIDPDLEKLNLIEKIKDKRVTISDLNVIAELYYANIQIALSVLRHLPEFDETSNIEDILKSIYVMRIKNLFEILMYITQTKFNINPYITKVSQIQNCSYRTQLAGPHPYRKERLNLFICKIGKALTENQLSQEAIEVWHSLDYTQNLIHLFVTNYIDPQLDPHNIRVLIFMAEFKMNYTQINYLGDCILTIEDLFMTYVYTNGNVIPIKTELGNFEHYPRPWCPFSRNYDPNHFFAGFCDCR